MLIALAFLILQNEGLRGTPPTYFLPVMVGSLVVGGIGWLIAAVLGFARARAFGASTRWFSFAAVCLLLYHVQFVLFGFVVLMSAQRNDTDTPLAFGAFLNVFVLLGAFCAIMGFIRLTNPR
jgi:Na+/phosphate symporter